MARTRGRKADQPAAPEGSVVIDLNKPPPKQAEPDKLPDYGKPPDEPVVKAPPLVPADDAGNDLQAQVDALKKREQAARQRAEQERSARVAAEQERQRAASAIQQEHSLTEQAQFDSVVNALAARQNEITALQASYQDAIARGDHVGAGQINDKMLDAKMDIRDLQNGKGEWEREFERRRRSPQPQQQFQQAPQSVQQTVDQIPGLLPTERQWLLNHPDVVNDQYLADQCRAAVAYATRQGFERGSDEYFEAIEERLGFDSEGEQPVYDEDDMMSEPAPAPPRRRYAAPPSRSAPGSGYRSGGSEDQIVLTPDQRMAAKISNVDEYTYAQGVRRLRELKKQGHYGETG